MRSIPTHVKCVHDLYVHKRLVKGLYLVRCRKCHYWLLGLAKGKKALKIIEERFLKKGKEHG